MTIDPGAKQAAEPWTTFTQGQEIPDWISKAYIDSYRGPHGDGCRRERSRPSTPAPW